MMIIITTVIVIFFLRSFSHAATTMAIKKTWQRCGQLKLMPIVSIRDDGLNDHRHYIRMT